MVDRSEMHQDARSQSFGGNAVRWARMSSVSRDQGLVIMDEQTWVNIADTLNALCNQPGCRKK